MHVLARADRAVSLDMASDREELSFHFNLSINAVVYLHSLFYSQRDAMFQPCFLYSECVCFHVFYQVYQTGFTCFLFVCFFSVRLLSVLRGHSIFSSPPQQPMTSDFEGFSIPDFIHNIYFHILILEKEPVFPFLMFSAKQGNYWYCFYNVFGMTRSLTGD